MRQGVIAPHPLPPTRVETESSIWAFELPARAWGKSSEVSVLMGAVRRQRKGEPELL